MPTLILSAGRDPNLLKKRNAALIAAGYTVVTAMNSPEVVNKLFAGDFDLVVLCHTLGELQQKRLAHIIRDYTPSTPVIVLSQGEERNLDADANPGLLAIKTALAHPTGFRAA